MHSLIRLPSPRSSFRNAITPANCLSRQLGSLCQRHGKGSVRRLVMLRASPRRRILRHPARLDGQGTCLVTTSANSLIRSQVSFTKPDGTTIDRLPPWITRVTQDLSVSPVYDGRFWNPPASEKYTFKHPRPAPIGGKDSTGGLKIYEAHGKSLPGSHHVGTDPWQSASRPRNPKSAATSSSGTMSSRESPSSATTASK